MRATSRSTPLAITSVVVAPVRVHAFHRGRELRGTQRTKRASRAPSAEWARRQESRLTGALGFGRQGKPAVDGAGACLCRLRAFG